MTSDRQEKLGSARLRTDRFPISTITDPSRQSEGSGQLHWNLPIELQVVVSGCQNGVHRIAVNLGSQPIFTEGAAGCTVDHCVLPFC